MFITKIYIKRIYIIFIFSCSLINLFEQVYAEDPKKNIQTIIIDAGHGGKDPGALGKNSKEKDIVLAISLKLGKYIEENFNDIKVIYTRDEDVFIPLHERAEIANKNDADLYISIHANSSDKTAAHGTSTHVLGLHRAEENFEVAKRENSVILLEEDYSTRYENFDPNSPESYIIFSLMQNIYFEQSIEFAQLVQEQFKERAKRKDRGVEQQGLLVLAQSSMPGALIETGFITNEQEEAYLMSDAGQDYIASAIFRAFRDYVNIIEKRSAFDEAIEEAKRKAELDSIARIVKFKVQVMASSMEVPLDSPYFSNFNDVEVFKVGEIYKYAIGTEENYQDIIKFNKRIKDQFPDAFVIAIKNGEIIPVKDALKELDEK